MCRAAIRNCAELVLAELDDFQPTAIQEPDDTSRAPRVLHVGRIPRCRGARARGVVRHPPFRRILNVEDEDWAARSQAQLRAITVGRIVIAPPWDADGHRSLHSHLIVIQPSMGFGTGHHATTRLMLRGAAATAARRIGPCSTSAADPASWRLRRSNLVRDRPSASISIRTRSQCDGERGAERDGRSRPIRRRRTSATMAARADVVMANLTGALLERSAHDAWRARHAGRTPDRQRIHGQTRRRRARLRSNTCRRPGLDRAGRGMDVRDLTDPARCSAARRSPPHPAHRRATLARRTTAA